MLAKKAFTSGVVAQQRTGAPARGRCVRVCSQKQGDGLVAKAQAVAAAVAAAALLQASPAFAGVVLEQPQLKKVFQDDGSAAPARQASGAPAAKKAAGPKKPAAVPSSSGGVSPQSIALPASLVVIAGGTFALSKIDEDWNDFVFNAAVKDSASAGAGYEVALKEGGAGAAKSRPASKPGTKKVKASGSQKGGLGGLFGK